MSEPGLLVTLLAIISALSAVFSAIAAYRSASSAKEANDELKQVRKDDLFREAFKCAHRVSALANRVTKLGDDLKVEYISLFAGAGRSGLREHHQESIEEKQRVVGPIQEQANDYADSERARAASASDLVRVITQFQADIVQLEGIKEDLMLDIGNLRDQNRARSTR